MGGRTVARPVIDGARLERGTKLGVLGPLLVSIAEQHGVRPSAGRMRRILSILAVAAMTGRPVGVDELAEAVYGDAPPARVRRSLFTEIWRCRQLLGGTEAIIG